MILPLVLFTGQAAEVRTFNAPEIVKQRHVDELWEFVQTLAGRKELPPLVYFSTEDEPVRSAKFLGFYYEYTNVIRIGPQAIFHRQFAPALGYFYVVIGHEMLHYVLAGRIPIEEHHCLFVRENYEKRIAEHLVNSGASHPILLATNEPSGCEVKPEVKPTPPAQKSDR